MSTQHLINELIRASAGTGKTHQLTNRFLRLLRLSERPDEILATTFTRKAAGEILNRLLLRMAHAATEPNQLSELRAALSDSSLSQQDCTDLVVDAARNLNRLRIGTLDSFFAQLAGSFSLELGLPPGWRIAEEHEDAALREQAVESVLDSESTADLLTLVHALTRGETTRSLQREVRDKVNTLYTTYRESNAKAWQRVPRSPMLSDVQLEVAMQSLRSIPLPAHKNWEKHHANDVAAAEQGDWAKFVTGGIAGKVAAGEDTYWRKPIEPVVAAAYQVLIDHAKAVLLNQLADQTEATFRLLDRFHQHYQRLKSQARALRFDDITFQLASRTLPLRKAEGQGDGGSQQQDSPHLNPFRGGEGKDALDNIAFRLDSRLHHLLLDEFQDTSLAQWCVVRPFGKRITAPPVNSPGLTSSALRARPGSSDPADSPARAGRGSPDPAQAATVGLKQSESGRPAVAPVARSGDRPQPAEDRLQHAGDQPQRSFFCVGDVKQAIYGWRGGVAEIFDAVKEQLDGIVEKPLNTNWRSSPKVIETVNQIFSRLDRHDNLGELVDAAMRWQSQFEPHEAAPKNKMLNGYVCLQAARVALDTETETQKEITFRFTAEQVARWKEDAPGYQIGVLVRRNDAVRRLIYELRELGIEASEEGGSSLDDSAAVRLLLSLIQLADHPSDLVARFHIATSPLAELWGLWGPAHFAGSSEQSMPVPSTAVPSTAAIDFADHSGNVMAGRLASQIRRRLFDDGYGPTIYKWARQLAPACNRRELRRLEKLIGLAYQFEQMASTRPRDFLSYVDSQKVRDPVAANVRVMTIHQAKGLEFDIVLLADLEADLIGQRGELVIGRPSPTEPIERVCRRCGSEVRQLLPESWQRLFRTADDQAMVESLCVLYVGVTRAIHALHMIVAPSAPSERTMHKTFGGVLRATLTGGDRLDPEQIAYANGDARWFDCPGVERTPSKSEIVSKQQSLAPITVRLASPAKQRRRGLERVSPSGLEGGTHVRLSHTWGDSGTERNTALQRGTLIHAWFEQILWLDEGPPSDDRLRQVANELIDVAIPEEDLSRQFANFRAMLANPKIATCLTQDAYQELIQGLRAKHTKIRLRVENERPIAVRHRDQLMVGNIDRLVTIYDNDDPIAADIIDYKTDAIEAGDATALTSKVDHYRPQIAAYRRAVATMYGIPPASITARLLFVSLGRVEPIRA